MCPATKYQFKIAAVTLLVIVKTIILGFSFCPGYSAHHLNFKATMVDTNRVGRFVQTTRKQFDIFMYKCSIGSKYGVFMMFQEGIYEMK